MSGVKGQKSGRKGKIYGSLEEQYGVQRALEIKQKLSESLKDSYRLGKHRWSCSAETKLKISKSIQKRFALGAHGANYGKTFSEEQKKKLSLAHIGTQAGIKHPNYGKKASPELRLKMSKSHLGKTYEQMYGVEGAKAQKEARRVRMLGNKHGWGNHPAYNKGKTLGSLEKQFGEQKAAEIRHKKSISSSGRGNPMYGKPSPHSKCCDTLKGHRVRSTWEQRVCDWLYTHDIEYQYEPQTFDFGTFTYTPDIYIPQWDAWWEVKGWWDELSQKKCQAFADTHPDNFQIIDKENINLFRGD